MMDSFRAGGWAHAHTPAASLSLGNDLGPQQRNELRQPGRVRWPGRGRDVLTIGHCCVNGDVGVGGTGEFHFRLASRVGADALATDNRSEEHTSELQSR